MAASATLNISSPTAVTATTLNAISAIGQASFEVHDAASIGAASSANLLWRGIRYANDPPMSWSAWPLTAGLVITAISGTVAVSVA